MGLGAPDAHRRRPTRAATRGRSVRLCSLRRLPQSERSFYENRARLVGHCCSGRITSPLRKGVLMTQKTRAISILALGVLIALVVRTRTAATEEPSHHHGTFAAAPV